jgi:hypothetical protein
MNYLERQDPDLWVAVAGEMDRQRNGLEMIASENYTSPAVMQAVGSVLTNKYAEGYPGKRYYGGCQFVDETETLAIERAKRLFGARHANVQPNSGSQMNQAVFLALLSPGDTFMGLDLNSGGHLTHGSPVNMSGKWFKVVPYGVRRDTQRIDMDEVEAHEHVARCHQGQEHCLVHLAARIRLDVGEGAGEQPFRPFDREALRHVDELAAAVVALARIALRVFVGENAGGSLQHGFRRKVLARDQLDLVLLTAELPADRGGDLGVGVGEAAGEEGSRRGVDGLGHGHAQYPLGVVGPCGCPNGGRLPNSALT